VVRGPQPDPVAATVVRDPVLGSVTDAPDSRRAQIAAVEYGVDALVESRLLVAQVRRLAAGETVVPRREGGVGVTVAPSEGVVGRGPGPGAAVEVATEDDPAAGREDVEQFGGLAPADDRRRRLQVCRDRRESPRQ
jgi:hypothetical protein